MYGRFSSVASLARQIHMDSSELRRKIHGIRRWYLKDIRALAETLETSMSYLIGDTDDPRPITKKEPARWAGRVQLVAGTGRSELLDLDSNQEPIGYEIARIFPIRSKTHVANRKHQLSRFRDIRNGLLTLKQVTP